ncbi:hypothetical protein HY745_01890 [Candidatus Desantisbacteria bacterium]|nr:hypothetical protein [Candidatus Desantisbacteria bacterium]
MIAKETINFSEEYVKFKKAKDSAYEKHINGNYKDAIKQYGSTLSKLQELLDKNKGLIEKNIQNDLIKLQRNLSLCLTNDGFFIVDKDTNKIKDFSFPDKIDNIIATALIIQDDIKVSLTSLASSPINLTLVLGYGWIDINGDYGVDTISSIEIDLKPSIIYEATFKGIPPVNEDTKEKTYSYPGVFLISSGNEKKQKINIQGIKNDFIFFTNLSQYYQLQSKPAFTINIAQHVKKNNIEYRLYIRKTAHTINNKKVKLSLKINQGL